MNSKLVEALMQLGGQIGRLCGLLANHGIITEEEGFWVINGDDDDQANAPEAKDKEVNNGKDS